MSSLFSDLYRYRERDKRESREDWLTECLAAVLRALPADRLAAVLSAIVKQPSQAIGDALLPLIETQKNHRTRI